MTKPSFITIFPGLGTSRTYLLQSGEEKILIDPGWPSSVLPIVKTHPDISVVVLTHHHYDHHGAAHLVKNITRSPIVAAENKTAKALELPPLHTFLGRIFRSWAKAGFFLPRIQDLLHIRIKLESIDRILKDEDFIDKKHQWRVIFTPGHTSDSICIYSSKYQLLFSGDTIVNPFGQPRWGKLVTDQYSFTASQKKITNLRIKWIYPGHGEPFLLSDVKMLYES